MKKINLIAFGVSVALGLTACNPNNNTEKAETSAVVAPPLTSGIDLEAIDKQVRAEDDLFRHVNGSWLAKTEIPADKSRYSTFNIIYDNTQEQLKALIQEAAESNAKPGSNNQKLGDMYNSYMDEALVDSLGYSPLNKELAAIAAVSDKQQAVAMMGSLFNKGVSGLMGYYVYPDAKNPSINGLWFYQSGLTLPDRDYYLKDEEKFQNFRAAMTTYIADILALSGHENAAEAADKILALETQVAENQLSRVESRDAEKNYNKRTKQEVMDLLGAYDWQAYASAIGIDAADEMIVRQYAYFEKLGELVASTDVQTLKDYMAFKLLDEYAPRLSNEFSELAFDFNSRTLHGVPEQRDRWKRAVAATSGLLGEVLGQQYVARHFKPEAKAKMDELVQNLIKAYGQSIKDLTWMTEETKKAALVKLSKFTPKIGYPNKWRDYSALEIKANDLVGNYLRYNQFEADVQNAKIGQPIDKEEWGMTPQTINAYYSPTRNEIVFPAGILQPPFFNMEADDAVNYGGIGAVIGHEIGHGFDDQGSKYDGDGNLRSWWTDEDREAFDALGKRLAAQYDAYEPIEGQSVNGSLTLGENIGDLAGAAIGYKAYMMSLEGKEAPIIDGLTGEQRLFMGFAQVWRGKYRDDALRVQLLSDPHSPGEFRTNGTVLNVDAFHEAFNTKEGDEMYIKPEDRIRIW